MIQDVGAEVGHVQIYVPVVVDVSDAGTHAIARMASTRLRRRIREGAVASVAIERVGGDALGDKTRQRRAVDRIEVLVAVVVVVEEGRARPIGFHVVVMPARSILMVEFNARLLRYLYKRRSDLRVCWSASRAAHDEQRPQRQNCGHGLSGSVGVSMGNHEGCPYECAGKQTGRGNLCGCPTYKG